MNLHIQEIIERYQIGVETRGFAVIQRAIETFGTPQAAVGWLIEDRPALNAKPINLLNHSRGVRDVDTVLGCIDHGIIF